MGTPSGGFFCSENPERPVDSFFEHFIIRMVGNTLFSCNNKEAFMEQYMIDVLHSCSLFDSIPEEKYPNVLHCLNASRRTFEKDETILNIGEYSSMAGIVLRGRIELSFFEENGAPVSITHLSKGEVFGSERACCDLRVSPVRLRALSSCEVLFLRFENLLNVGEVTCPFRARFTANLLRDFARQNQFLNLKLRILGQKHLRDKIKVYLQSLPVSDEGSIELPYSRRELAEFLSADRSALSRELCRMRDEGLLTFDGSHIRITDRSFFLQ